MRWELTETLYQTWVCVHVRREGVLQKREVIGRHFPECSPAGVLWE